MVTTRKFVLHLGEMFLAMVVGMAALDAVFEGILAVAGTSYAVLVDDAPTAVALILMFNMTAPMHRGSATFRTPRIAPAAPRDA